MPESISPNDQCGGEKRQVDFNRWLQAPEFQGLTLFKPECSDCGDTDTAFS